MLRLIQVGFTYCVLIYCIFVLMIFSHFLQWWQLGNVFEKWLVRKHIY